MSNNIISKIELPNGEVYDIVDVINLGKDDNGNIISSTYKMLQQIVANPTTNGETTAFIDTISQNAQGVITATKKNIPLVSSTTNGLMSIEDKTKLDGIDLTQYLPLSGDTMTGTLQINDATPSSSVSTGALVVSGGVGIGGNVNVGGALNVGDPVGTRANLGITPANIGALSDTTTATDIGALPNTTTATDIGASATFVLTGDHTTAATVYNVLNTMPRGSVATIVTQKAASYPMCGVDRDMYGTIWRNPFLSSNGFYLSMTTTSGDVQYCYVLTLTDSSMSHGTVYKYTGTAV